MRYIYCRAVGIVVLLVASCVVAFAQENRRVEVTATYRPEVSQATKLIVPTTIDDAPIIEPEIEYNVRPQTWQVSLETADYEPVAMNNYDFRRATPLYAKVGVGYPLASDVALRYGIHNLRVGYLGIGVEHRGDFARRSNGDGVLRSAAESYNMHNGVVLGGGVFAGKRLFEASMSYVNDIYNRYAELSSEPACVGLHRTDVSLRFGDDFCDMSHLNFAVELHSGYWAHKLPMLTRDMTALNEFSGGASLRLAGKLGGGMAGIDVGYDLWRGNRVFGYQDSRFDVGVDYRRRWGFVDFEVGVAYMYDMVKLREKPSHFVLPHLKVLFDIKKAALAPYVEVSTHVAQNDLSSLYDKNPYIDFGAAYDTLTHMANGVSYDMSVGIDGSLFATRFTYRVYAGVNLQRNHLFWYVTLPGKFGVVNGNNDRMFYGVELGCRPISGLMINAGFEGHVDSTDFDFKYLSSEPKFKADVRVEYAYEGWRFYASADVLGRREWSVLDADGVSLRSEPFTAQTCVDLQLGAAYRIKNGIELYLDGTNLLNNRIYDYAYYYRRGIGFMCGVKLNF